MHKAGKVVTRECRKAKSAHLEFAFVSAFRDNSSCGLNILGPLCLWQCLEILIGQFGDHNCRDFDIDPSNGVM